ncbi:MAG: L-serine ammonia-lyase, iron-sulfur-dependent subunit beta [Promethearchaeota archaeon]
MKYDSLFDVVGHIMIGPSSSHTAGACQIAYIARLILIGEDRKDKKIKKAIIKLHGSFAETYKGHGTDKALLGGLLGCKPDDERLRESFNIVKEIGLEFKIEKVDLGADYHPNSVLLELYDENNTKLEIIGSSIGGGNIIIKEINGMEAGFAADKPTLILINEDKPGVIAKITKIIADFNYNINHMKITQNIPKKMALTWIELSKKIIMDLVNELNKISEIKMVRWLNV